MAVPGFLLSRWLLPGVGALERALTSLVIGIVSVAPTTFLLSVVFGTPETPELIVLISVMWALIGWSLGRWLPCEPQEPMLDALRSKRLLGLAVLLCATTAVSTSYYALQTDYVWWHCPHHASLYMMEDGTSGGIVSWDPARDRHITNLFAHPVDSGFGLGPVLRLQRPGNIAFLSQPFVFLSLGGLVGAMFVIDLLIFGFSILLAARHLRSAWAPVVVAALFLCGSRWLAVYQLNECMLALALSMGLLQLLLRPASGRFAIASAAVCGVIAGHWLGVRPLGLLMAPAFLLLCVGSWRRMATATGAAACAVFPWLYVNAAAFGAPVKHPALANAGQTQTLFAGTPLEWTFVFHPLNWPFADQLSRGPDDPFPVVLRLPLELIQAYGAPLLAVILVGLFALRTPRRKLAGLLAWLIALPLFLMLIVELGAQKLSYTLIALAPFPLLMAAGARALADGTPQLRAAAGCLAAVITFTPMTLHDVMLPLDPRQHHTEFFSRDSRPMTFDELPEANAVYQLEERERLTSVQLWPSMDPSLDLTWSTRTLGANLFATAGLAQRRTTPDDPIEGPVVVWREANAEWRPLSHKFTLATADAPTEFTLGPEALEGDPVGSGAGTLYVFRWPAPAPKSVQVALHRAPQHINNRMTVALQTSEDTVDEERYATFLVIDPSTGDVKAPELRIDKRRRTLHFVADVAARQTEPRIVSNFEWAVIFGERRLSGAAGRAQPLATPDGWETVCATDRGGRLVRRCTAPTVSGEPVACRMALLDSDQRVIAGRTETGSKVIAAGSRFPPLASSDPCVARMLVAAVSPAASAAAGADESAPGP